MMKMNTNRLEIADQFGTPLYVYDSGLIRTRYRELRDCFPWPVRLLYAMKANYNPAILRILQDEGASIDAVSPSDVLLALKAGFSADQILFTANRTTEAEMKLVYDTGVLCNLGSLSQLRKFGMAHPGGRVCIRLNPEVVAGENKFVSTAGENSKFGIAISRLDEVKELVHQHRLRVTGFHEHTGSGIPETVAMKRGIKNILSALTPEDFPDLEFLDFGGGFKVSYRADESPMDYSGFGGEISAMFEAFCETYGRKLEMCFEPGKYLVAESGSLLVTVTDIVTTPNKQLAGVNSGFPQLIRPMFYGAWHEVSNLSNPEGPEHAYDVVGNICESGDCFATDRRIAEIREGDILAIETAGAYCYSMGGHYNLRPMPAEVLIDNGRLDLITPRQSHSELAEQVFSGHDA